jgi:hypothetical protein
LCTPTPGPSPLNTITRSVSECQFDYSSLAVLVPSKPPLAPSLWADERASGRGCGRGKAASARFLCTTCRRPFASGSISPLPSPSGDTGEKPSRCLSLHVTGQFGLFENRSLIACLRRSMRTNSKFSRTGHRGYSPDLRPPASWTFMQPMYVPSLATLQNYSGRHSIKSAKGLLALLQCSI